MDKPSGVIHAAVPEQPDWLNVKDYKAQGFM